MARGSRRRGLPRAFTAICCAGAVAVIGLAARPFILDELAIRNLASPSESTRKEAADWLAKRRCMRAIPALLATLAASPAGPRELGHKYAARALDQLLSPDAAQVVKRLQARSRWDGWRIQASLDCLDRDDDALEAIISCVGYEDLGITPPSALGAFGRRAVKPLIATLSGRRMAGSDLEHIWSHNVCLSLSAIGPAARDAISHLLPELEKGPLEETEWRRRDDIIDPQDAAAFALGSLGEDMLEVDGGLLDSPRAEARAGAARRLGLFLAPDSKRVGIAEALERLAALPGQSARIRAILGFLEDGARSDEFVRASIDALSDVAGEERNAYLAILPELPVVPEALIETLQMHLGPGDGGARVLAARALLGIESQREKARTVLLAEFLGSADSSVRAQCALALAKTGSNDDVRVAVSALFEWLETGDAILHAAAAEALHSLPTNVAATPILESYLAGESQEARAYAVFLLARADGAAEMSLSALRGCASSREDESGALAALALHVLGDNSEEVRLRAFSNDSAAAVRLLADVLSRTEPSALDLQALLSMLSWPETQRAWQRAANGSFLWCRLATRPAPVPPEWEGLARDARGNATMRLRAALAAGRAGPGAASLATAMIDAASSWGAPGLLVGPLAQIGPGCVPQILDALQKPASVELRAVLLLALGRMGTGAIAAVPILLRSLDDPDPAIAITAAGALARMGKAAELAIPTLEALSTARPEVARSAAKALEEIESRPAGRPPIQRQYGAPLLHPGANSASRLHAALCERKR